MAAVKGDIMQLLDDLSMGDPGNVSAMGDRYTKRPNMNPGSDPRAQAMQRYMEMRGAEQVPNPGFRMPDAQRPGQTITPAPWQRQEAVQDMAAAKDDADYGAGDMNPPGDPNAYFEVKDYGGNVDDQLEAESMRQNMRRPTYTDSKGRPSPSEDYTDEDLLSKLAARLNSGNR